MEMRLIDIVVLEKEIGRNGYYWTVDMAVKIPRQIRSREERRNIFEFLIWGIQNRERKERKTIDGNSIAVTQYRLHLLL
jgi:hypothetical protein